MYLKVVIVNKNVEMLILLVYNVKYILIFV